MKQRAPYSPAPLARNPCKSNIFAMTIRTRKFLGTILLLVLVVVWSLAGMAAAQMPLIANSGWLQAIYYVVVGIGWVLPAMPIISWMSRPRA